MALQLSAPQYVFLRELDSKFRAYVGGFGSGKTFVGCLDLLLFALENPGTTMGYFGPSYPSIRDIFYPTFEEAAELLGLRVETMVSTKEVSIYDGNGAFYGRVICRSMDKPGSIIGFKISRAIVDELDVLEASKAEHAWNKIIARMRLVIPGKVNSIGVTTTPEGYRFVYDRFANKPKSNYSMVQASTYENIKNLPDDYISSLYESYPEELVKAYLDGEFVNLKGGTVYYTFDRKRCNSSETVQEKEPLYLGMDFNVDKMASVVYVKRGKTWHAVDEFCDLYDTPAMIKAIKAKYPQHKITVYPDASGDNRKSSGASNTDIKLLEKEGFTVKVKGRTKNKNGKNPMVKDRILASCAAFEKGCVLVNVSACKEFARCLEQQAYNDAGEPDKSSGLDHMNDAGTYPIAYEFPVTKPISRVNVKF